MKMYLGYPIVASLLLCIACGSDEGKPEGSSTSGAEVGDDKAFETCTKELKPLCGYDESETACAALTTPVIPLTNGMNWGGTELKQGPYGSYVEWNEGAAFKNPTSFLEATCPLAAAAFGEPESVTADVLDLRGQDLALYTVFRPACMKEGEKYPVITWGNGTCGQSGGYATLLATVASHGFVVFASNSRWTDGGNNEMLKALDFAKAANEDKTSPLYQKLDLDKIGAMGHSQGASATANAGKDPRIKALILWNGAGTSMDKPFLSVSGERDISANTPASMAAAVDGATQPGAWLFYHQVLETGGSVTGHLTLMEQAERVTEPAIAWWKYILNDDPEAKKMFVGADCGLCKSKDEFEFGQHNLP
jgi:Chlorophyllase enzyme